MYDNLKAKGMQRIQSWRMLCQQGMVWSFQKEDWLKNVKITKKVVSAEQEEADEFPDTIKKISKEEGYY